MNRTDRLFAITHALQAAGNRGRTADWLAQRFEVSTRTIKRDIAALLAAGTPIHSQDGRGGGYQLMSHSTLPLVSLSPSEVTAVAIALAGEPQLPFAADGQSALQKLLAAMSREQRRVAQDTAARVWMMRKPRDKRHRSARILDEALRLRVVAVIDYEDGDGRQTKNRRIEPMAFVRSRWEWHVLGWCHLREAGRWFRLDRVTRAKLTRVPQMPRVLQDVFGEPPADAMPVTLPS